jgi:hypothetical protein
MGEINIQLYTGSAAFADDLWTEAARILAKLAYDIEHDGEAPRFLFDSQGNRVGGVHYDSDEGPGGI